MGYPKTRLSVLVLILLTANTSLALRCYHCNDATGGIPSFPKCRDSMDVIDCDAWELLEGDSAYNVEVIEIESRNKDKKPVENANENKVAYAEFSHQREFHFEEPEIINEKQNSGVKGKVKRAAKDYACKKDVFTYLDRHYVVRSCEPRTTSGDTCMRENVTVYRYLNKRTKTEGTQCFCLSDLCNTAGSFRYPNLFLGLCGLLLLLVINIFGQIGN